MIIIKNKVIRKILKYFIPFVLIPVTAILGTLAFDEKKHIFVSLFIAVLTLIFFVAGLEKKEIGTRRMVIVSVMIALSVVGRFIPLFKPVMALTIITAMYLGGESGFMVGAFSLLLSNFYFGQGPWTPFQMLAYGFIGLIAGSLSKLLKKNIFLLLLFGVASGVLFSAVMDLWNVLWYGNGFDMKLYFLAMLSAAPYTALYSISNVFFLLLLSNPLGKKIERIKKKYNI